jgi:hypothetical protein
MACRNEVIDASRRSTSVKTRRSTSFIDPLLSIPPAPTQTILQPRRFAPLPGDNLSLGGMDFQIEKSRVHITLVAPS